MPENECREANDPFLEEEEDNREFMNASDGKSPSSGHTGEEFRSLQRVPRLFDRSESVCLCSPRSGRVSVLGVGATIITDGSELMLTFFSVDLMFKLDFLIVISSSSSTHVSSESVSSGIPHLSILSSASSASGDRTGVLRCSIFRALAASESRDFGRR